MKNILLENKRERYAYNTDKFISVDLESNQGLLPISDITDTINEYEQYYREYDASNRYRMIFTINPFCSNVLFNPITEIVYNEGSDGCIFFGKNGPSDGKIPDTITEYNEFIGRATLDHNTLMTDTAYSSKYIGPLVYHCGYDIFSNHTLRSKDFVIVNKQNDETEKRGEFNTISDYLRTSDGKIVQDSKISEGGNVKKFSRHLYTMDTIDSFTQSITNNLSEENGWIGFKNPVSLNVDNFKYENGDAFPLNKCMNNNKPGEFIDMYPDRSLFSFMPKYNKFRKRQEKNWEYCLTYPFSSTTNNFIEDENGVNGIKCSMVLNTILYPSDGNKLVLFKSSVKHNLQVGSKIKISCLKDGTLFETNGLVNIVSVGRNGYDGDAYFSVYYSDIFPVVSALSEERNKVITPDKVNGVTFRFAKYVNGTRCKYYYRKLKKLENASFTLNKLAFAKNIYNDRVVELLFDKDVDVTGLKDNLGREVSELFLTIVKTNYGHKEWYENNNNNNYTGETIEYSHCFGKVTSGIDILDGSVDYNIHKIHNVDTKSKRIPDKGQPLEDDIDIRTCPEYLCDLVEFSPTTITETTLSDVFHRFNTAQREIDSNEFSSLIYTDIMHDDFDVDVSGETIFTIEERNYVEDEKNINLFPEGYYYKPNYSIKLREFNNEVHQGKHQKVVYTEITNDGVHYTIKTSLNYYLEVGKELYLFDKSENKQYIATITDVNGNNYTQITFTAHIDSGSLKNVIIMKPNELKPVYAYELNDGTGRYLWRDFVKASEISKNSILYDRPFTNGAHYIYNTINFYLRRQDPDGYYGLSYDYSGEMKLELMNLIIDGNRKYVDKFDYVENTGDIC